MRYKLRLLFTLVLLLSLLILNTNEANPNNAVIGHSVWELSNYGGFEAIKGDDRASQDLTVAVIDTGISPHKDLDENLILFKDFVHGRIGTYDDNGHGTEVSGIIAGRGTASKGRYAGISPDTKLIMLKAFNQEGTSDLLTFSEAVEWIIDNRIKYNIRIVCMSLGFNVNPHFDNIIMKELMDRLFDSNIVLITSAGNDGINGQITLPGTYDNVLTVGSLDYDPDSHDISKANISVFSSRISPNERKPDLYAPGESVITTSSDGEYTTVKGTSFAAAMVTGQVALVVQKYPKKSASDILFLVKEKTSGKIFSYKS